MLSYEEHVFPTRVSTRAEALKRNVAITSLLQQVETAHQVCASSGGGIVGPLASIPFADSAKAIGQDCIDYRAVKNKAAFEIAQMLWSDLIGSGSQESQELIKKIRDRLPGALDSTRVAQQKIFELLAALYARPN